MRRFGHRRSARYRRAGGEPARANTAVLLNDPVRLMGSGAVSEFNAAVDRNNRLFTCGPNHLARSAWDDPDAEADASSCARVLVARSAQTLASGRTLPNLTV